MPNVDPCSIIAEILGKPASQASGPAASDFLCPYTQSRCTKTSQRDRTTPFPVCSVYKSGKRSTANIIAVCPKRFLGTKFIDDAIEHCWRGRKVEHLAVVREIKMAHIGTVDVVIADVNSERTQVAEFLSVELQAIDITGSYHPAYSAIVNRTPLPEKPTYGFNWANVKKRYVSQLISKCFFHHQWGARIAAVLQDHIFDYFKAQLEFDEVELPRADVVFLIYKYQDPTGDLNEFGFVLDRVVGTTHNSLMMKALYTETPPREDFCKRILDKLGPPAGP